MADSTSIAVLVGFVSVLTLFFVFKFYSKAVLPIFCILVLILSGTGYYIVQDTAAVNIFEMFIILGAIGLLVSIMYLIYELFVNDILPALKAHNGPKGG